MKQYYLENTSKTLSSSNNEPNSRISKSTISDLKGKINNLKSDIKILKEKISLFQNQTNNLPEINNIGKLLSLHHPTNQKWHIKVKLVINQEFTLETIALVDSGSDLNCII